MKFKKGDTVIYPQHGACIVHGIKRMKAFGAVQEYIILKTVINEMTLSVPTAMANQVGVRPPVSKSELEDLRSVLSKADPRVPANWSRRFKNHQEKLKSGDVYQVAEVVRNLAARDRDSALSAAEKTMYDRARINLISEISPALKVSTDAAEVWLDAALEQGVLKPSKGAKIVKQIPKDDAKPVAKAVAKDAAKPVAKAVKVAKVAKAPAKAVAKKK
ncbi:MAG: CarD family transcriptional regulator [Actinobacteria bacterium]|nr:CarD family transcriptional regulator [Actinomycetota bacterium]MDA2952417.1 CarD family transcriptional regulator [Actinomycetota bacterium]MDA2999603.1 CarD family transcriptional regulator [Actinomycetota bacterium]